ncbi:MAG: hypothetical protein RIG77_22510 [Cyclobacteriaceae bacterium]
MVEKSIKRIKKVLKGILGIQNRNPRPSVIRRDVTTINVDSNFQLLVYWKVLPIGKGPAIILKVLNKEFMKFDCFGKDKGHYHISPKYNFRIFFIENTRKSQIKRSINELKTNTQNYLKHHPDQRFNQLVLSTSAFYDSLDRAEQQLIAFVETIVEFQEPSIKVQPNHPQAL